MASVDNPGPSRIILEKNLSAEIKARSAALDFSQTQRGPNCNGCFNLVFETTCTHAHVVKKRCNEQPNGLVCAGTEILTVHFEDVTLALGSTRCASCSKIRHRREYEDRSKAPKKLYTRKFSPKTVAARTRMNAVKEQWQRMLVDHKSPVPSLTRGQIIALAAEKGEELKASSSSSGNSNSSKRILPPLADRPRMLHNTDLEKESSERCKFLLQKGGSVSRAEHEDDPPQSTPDDPSPAFVFRSPLLSEFANLLQVDTTGKQPSSKEASS